MIDALGLLLRTPPEGLDAAIETVLHKLAVLTGADRAYLQVDQAAIWTNTHEWCAEGVAPMKAMLQGLPAAVFTPAAEATTPDALTPGVPRDIPSVTAMPPGPRRDILIAQGIQSLATVPLPPASGVGGILGLDRVQHLRGFTDYDFWLLRTLSDGLASALARRAAEQALGEARAQQSETMERLRATLAAMPELVLELDETGRCLDYHCSAPDLLARPGAEILGHTLEETLPAPVAALQRAGMAQAMRDGTAQLGPYALGKYWYTATIALRARIGGKVGFVFRIRDVTKDHVRDAENALLVELTRRMTNLAVVLDPDQRLRWINPAMEERTGQTADSVRGQPLSVLGGITGDPVEVEKITTALQTRTPARAEVWKQDRLGRRYCTDTDLQPFARADGAFAGFLLIGTDITDRKHHEADLQRMAEAADVAHQKLQDAISAMPDGFAFFDAQDRLVLHNDKYLSLLDRSAPTIHTGMTFGEILDHALTAGDFPDARGREVAWKAHRMALHAEANDMIELRLSGGRWMRAYERKTPDGGRVGLRIDVTAIKEAEQRLKDIIDGAKIAIWEYDIATRSAVVNANWGRLMGLEPGVMTSVTRENWDVRIHPDDAEQVRMALRATRAGDSDVIETEIRLRHQDGHWVHVLARGRAMDHGPDGRPTRVSGVGLDLTERRQAEERLHTILKASSIGTWQLTCETGKIVIDAQYALMLGYSLDELLPWTREKFEALLHPDDLLRLRADVAALYDAQKSEIGHEFRLRHRDGHWIWILSQARVMRWQGPRVPAEESGVHIDITERKIRDEALADATRAVEKALAAHRDSEQRFADIAAVSDEWFWEIGEAGHILNLTAGFERMTGMSVDKIRGALLRDLGFSPGSEAAQGDWDGLLRHVTGRLAFSDFLFRLTLTQGGPAVWLRVSGAPYFRADGSYAGYRGVGSNVSALIGATERAEAASLAKSRFLANMSHELRTPLTGVLGMAELLGETAVSQHQRDMIDTIRESGEGLLAIVNDILDLAKVEAGKMTIDTQAFAPSDVLRQVRALYAPRAHTAGLALSLDTTADCSVMRLGDANRIQQILNNLVGNAIKFTPKGSVSLSGRIEAANGTDVLKITVADTGIGMTPEQTAKVFEEFEQAEGSTARRFGGTGLGLSITRHLVGLLGGTISLESVPDGGTRVAVSLPLAAANPAAQDPPVPAALPVQDLAGLRVLVADDNQANRKILEAMLTRLGIAVTLAVDGHDALRLYQAGAFDLILLDISMPGLDGIGALQAIRQTEAAHQIIPVPALAVTANAMQHQIDEYLAAGFAGHVGKPFRKTALVYAIARHHVRPG